MSHTRGGKGRRSGGGRFCAELRGTFSSLREGPENPPTAAVAQRPPLRFPLKEVAQTVVEHPVKVRLD